MTNEEGKNMPPLPPRPKTVQEEKPDEELPARTLLEQQGGRDALKLARAKLEAEMEGGRELVAYYERRRVSKLTKDSEEKSEANSG